MPVIEARRSGPCGACGGRIVVGERIDYTLADGPRHLVCADRDGTEWRTNRHPKPCHVCGSLVPRGKGRLEVVERETASGWERTWLVSCADVEACNRRLSGRK